MKRQFRFLLFMSIISSFLLSCSDSTKNVIKNFDPLTNMGMNDTVVLSMDLDNAIVNGIMIPSAQQTDNGYFTFSFEVEKPESSKKYYYKIYYQNSSYKFPELKNGSIHPYCHENFYGSWEDVSSGFKKVNGTNGSDNFRIVGNPRDERLYYGGDMSKQVFSQERINSYINSMRTTPEWFKSIQAKAEKENRNVEQQLFLDALWMIKDESRKGDFNHRWKRNPRVGNYEFMLVVADEAAISDIPDYIKNIGNVNDQGSFINPFYYFRYGEGSKLAGVSIVTSERVLKVSATIEPAKGIYINPGQQRDEHIDTQYLSDECNSTEQLYEHAHFEQFSHAINRGYTMRNVPLVRDVINEPYTQDDFFSTMEKYDSTELVVGHAFNSQTPCETAYVQDSVITLINPGNVEGEELRKQNVGVKTRIGFTYGKFRGKIKFPRQLNEDNVWNGITNAFWLIYQDEAEWNNRRPAERDGYIPKGEDGEESLTKKQKNYFYSEIDIEIVKTSPTWDNEEFLKNDDRESDNVMFCCTNWDLANQDPPRFFKGVDDISYKNKTFELHRWTDYYKAITSKYPIKNDKLYDPEFFYYEIEWKPTEIIWRAGPSPDNMELCGYMNDKYTSIPNNQMLGIITQEFHYAEWWPFQPFSQNGVPFPKNDIKGKVYEIVVE